MQKRSFVLAAFLVVLPLIFASVIFAQDAATYDDRYSFDIPEGYTVMPSLTTDLVRLTNEGSFIIVAGPESYGKVVGAIEFADDDEALALYLDRSGYDVGDVLAGRASVALPRAGQTGFAELLDLENGRQGVLLALGDDGGDEDAVAVIRDSLVYPADIVDVAVAAGDFTTLVAAVQAAGLEDTLRGGEFTVLAPTDDAFAAALEALGITAEELLASEDLADILTYHVIEGTVLAETVVTLDEATTVNGAPISITVVDGGVVLNDSVNVVATDIAAFNGVIHVIDAVLLPPAEEEMAEMEEAEEEMVEMEPREVASTYEGRYSFDVLEGYEVDESLTNDLVRLENEESVIIVVGPDSYGDVLGAVEFESDAEALEFYLDRTGYDVLEVNEADAAIAFPRRDQVGYAELLDLENGRQGVILVLGGTIDEEAANVIIDSIVYPGDIVDVAIAAGDFTTLVAAVQAAGLEGDLRSGELTVLAPTDAAFAAALEDLGITAEDLLASEGLADILTYHVIEGAVLAETVVTLDEATALNGGTISISVVDGGVVLNDSVNVVATDIEAFNGVIHVIDAVLFQPVPFAVEPAEPKAVASTFEGRYSFGVPEGYVVDESLTNDLVRLDAEDGSTIIVVGPDSYATALGAVEFASDAEALAFYVDRTGYDVGATDGEFLQVVFPRRNQTGFAQLVDLGNGRQGVVIALGAEAGDAAGVATIVDSIDYPGDLVDVAIAAGDFTTLVAAVQAAGLEDTLRGGEFTVFAPTDAAFEALLAELGVTAEELLAREDLADILTYHVVEGTVLAADAGGLGEAATVNGASISLVEFAGGVVINESVNVVAADIAAFNGVIHVIDAVLLPPMEEEME